MSDENPFARGLAFGYAEAGHRAAETALAALESAIASLETAAFHGRRPDCADLLAERVRSALVRLEAMSMGREP